MSERFQLPQLNHDEGTPEQVAHRLAAHAVAYEVSRLELEPTGWASFRRELALEVAGHMRQVATRLFESGTRGLEQRVADELARMRGFPCSKCGHPHEGLRYQFRCFQCLCAERPQSPSALASKPR